MDEWYLAKDIRKCVQSRIMGITADAEKSRA
jgi:hypothetical protein